MEWIVDRTVADAARSQRMRKSMEGCLVGLIGVSWLLVVVLIIGVKVRYLKSGLSNYDLVEETLILTGRPAKLTGPMKILDSFSQFGCKYKVVPIKPDGLST